MKATQHPQKTGPAGTRLLIAGALSAIALAFTMLFTLTGCGRGGSCGVPSSAKAESRAASPAVSSAVSPSASASAQRAAASSAAPGSQPSTSPAGGTPVKSGKVVYLTFDDGPSSNTGRVLDILKQNGVHGTFFVVGKDDEKSRQTLKRIVAEGNVIGVHSWTHDYAYIYKNEANFLSDFNKLSDFITATTGVRPQVCRFPGGTNNTQCLKYGGPIMGKLLKDVQDMGFQEYDWNASAADASNPVPTAQQVRAAMVNTTVQHKTCILLCHDSGQHDSTVQALPDVIRTLRNQYGYTFRTLDKNGPDIRFKPHK